MGLDGSGPEATTHSTASEHKMDQKHEVEGMAMPDMIVVVANQTRFRRHVIEQRMWYPISLADDRLEALRWIAIYNTSPVHAITHLARILSIKPYRNSGKYQINFVEPFQLMKPVRLDSENIARLAGHRYSWVQRLFEAKFISDLKPWGRTRQPDLNLSY
jgi:hypothetical protein